MQTVDLEELKRSIVAREAQASYPRPSAENQARAQRRRAAEAEAQAQLFDRTGIVPADIRATLDAQRQDGRNALAPFPDGEKATRAAFQAETARLLSLQPFAGRAVPLDQPTVTIFSEPFFISQYPNNLLYLQSESIAPFDSRIRTLIEGNVSTGAIYTFWFLWLNDSDSLAVVSASGQLTFNGTAIAECNESGFFGAKRMSLGVDATLELAENDGTVLSAAPWQTLVGMKLQGGLFSDAREEKWLDYLRCYLFAPAYIVAPRTPLLVKVLVGLSYSFTNGEDPNDGDPGNNAVLDFASERAGYFIGCRQVAVTSSPLRLL